MRWCIACPATFWAVVFVARFIGWLHDLSVLGSFMFAGSTTLRKRLAAVKVRSLLAGVGELVRHNVALVGEPFEIQRLLGHIERA